MTTDPMTDIAPGGAAGSPRRRTALLGIGALVVGLLALGVVLTLTRGGGTPKVHVFGRMGLESTGIENDRSADSASYTKATTTDHKACSTTDSFDDIAPGTAVTINDPSGKTIGTATLGDGVVLHYTVEQTVFDFTCSFSWDAGTLPKEPFYKVQISHRGEVTFTLVEARAGALDTGL